MNNSVSPGRWFRKHQSSTSASLIAVAFLSATFWLVTSALASPKQVLCTVCHRRTTTLMLPCDGLEYQRHLDHGDTMGACMMTPPVNQ